MDSMNKNFNAGPATLPFEVLQQAGKDIVDFQEMGIGLILSRPIDFNKFGLILRVHRKI